VSVEAISWALGLQIDRSSAKFVLVAMANCANHDMTCWPSIQYLTDATCQNRKTVVDNIRRLKEVGLITDTGERKGGTGQIPVYLLNKAEKNRPENDPVKEDQKRNGTENGTGPETDGNRPVFSTKQARFYAETDPKTGHGTVRNRKQEPSGNRHKAETVELPPWMPADAWAGFVAMRRAIKKPLTAEGIPLAIKKLDSMRAAGQDPRAVLEQSTMNNYQGLFDVKSSSHARVSPDATHLGKAGQETAAAGQRLKERLKGMQ